MFLRAGKCAIARVHNSVEISWQVWTKCSSGVSVFTMMPNLLWLCNHTHLIPDFHSNHAAIVYFPLQMWYQRRVVICDINDNNNGIVEVIIKIRLTITQ